MRLLASRLVGAAAQAGLLVLLARLLPVADFGEYATALATGAVIFGVLGLGFPTRSLLVGHPDDSRSRRIIATWSSVLGLTTSGIAIIVASLLIHGLTVSVLAGAIVSGVELCVTVYQGLLFGRQAHRKAELVMVSRRVIPLASVAALSTWGPTLALTALMISSIVSALAAGWIAHDGFAYRGLGGEVRSSRAYWFANVAAMAQQLDVVIVTALLSPVAAAGFSAGFRLASPAHIVTTLLTARLTPEVRLARDASTSPWASRLMRWGLAYSAAIILASPLLASTMVLILGPQYGQFYLVFAILTINTGISVVNQLLQSWIFAKGTYAGLVAYSSIFATVLGLSFIVIAATLTKSIVLVAVGTSSIQIWLLIALLAIVFRKVRRNDP